MLFYIIIIDTLPFLELGSLFTCLGDLIVSIILDILEIHRFQEYPLMVFVEILKSGVS